MKLLGVQQMCKRAYRFLATRKKPSFVNLFFLLAEYIERE
jgi:hypothetical protein